MNHRRRMRIHRWQCMGWVLLCLAPPALADLSRDLNAILATQRNVRYSVLVAKAATGQVVYEHRGHDPMIPASNMKVVTTAAALHYLGEDFQYCTRVGLSGQTLVIVGSGDPLLGDPAIDAKYNRTAGWIMADIATKLRQAEHGHINDIVVDTTVFDDQRTHPNWPANDLNRWFACEICGLNYNDNCIALTVRNDRGKIVVLMEPRTQYVRITNQVKATQVGKGAVGAYRQPGAVNSLTVKGSCSKEQGPFDVAIERPAAFFGYLLAEKLGQMGIATSGQVIEKAVDDTGDIVWIGEYRTSIIDCLARCNKDSLNLAAESLLKTIAAKAGPSGKNGGWTNGQERIADFLVRLGVPGDEFVIDDGSGLSQKNRLSANALVQVLLSMGRGGCWPLYKESLAVGGVDGTIDRYFNEPKYKGKVLGKTGSINGVKAFSGVCLAQSGDYIFSILANKPDGKTRTAINAITKAIIDND